MPTLPRPQALLLAVALCPGVSAAVPEPPQEPQGLFRWSMSVEDLGRVELPASGSGGWASGPNGIYYRGVPSFSGDPTYEVIIRAPHSGSALYPERLLVQLPADFNQRPFGERAVVVGFHSFSVSEKDIFLNTSLPFEAAERGWMLVAPYGLTDTNFANPQTQASLEAVFHVLYSVVPFNYRRVYGVGFSMGGLGALSFGVRHLDRQQLQFAGVVVHTGTLDMLEEYADSPPVVQQLLSNSRHFKGDPQTASFEYERVSPVQFLSNGLVDGNKAPVLNFASRPVYLHTNLADSHTGLVADMAALSSFLQQRGANVLEHLCHDPALGHDWGTLPLGAALDFVAAHELDGSPSQSVEIFADNPGRWLHTQVESISSEAFGRFRLELSPIAAASLNSFALQATRDLDEVRIELAQLGLDPALPLRILHGSADGTSDTLRIGGYGSSPAAVTIDGLPDTSWTFAGGTLELVLQPTADGHALQIDVQP